MKGKWILISMLALGLMLALVTGLSMAQGPEPQGGVTPQAALGTVFTYQGRLTDGGSPANGAYDFQFKLYDAASNGAQVGSTITMEDVTITDGLFTVALDFGSNAFTGDARYLEIGVRPGSSTGAYTTLTPRQALTATPYALFSLNADLLDDLNSTDFLRTSGGTLGGNLNVTGNVGVGTTSPQEQLDVMGDIRISAHWTMTDTHSWTMGILSAGEHDWFYIKDADDTYEPYRLLIDQDTGDVGIGRNLGVGTEAPQAKLHVAGTSQFDGVSQFNLGSGSVSMSTPGGWPGIIAYSPNNGHRREMVFRDNMLQILTSDSDLPSANDNGIIINEDGDVGIGTTNPQAKLDVNGTSRTKVLQITGGSDLAEPFEIGGAENIEPGMVVAIDPQQPGQLRIADKAYDRTVAGCVSGANGVNPGLTMQQDGTVADEAFPVALSGRVYCWADASHGPIQPGDLLTTSDTPGHAMKVTDYAMGQGAILGKAMSSLDEGKGLVLVLVTLQ
jgi:hypothetical protein